MKFKFRAWDKRHKKMGEVKAWSEFNGGEITIKRNGQNASYVIQAEDVTLMQSTGLFDVNGSEIFEFDILEKNRNQELTNEWRQVYATGVVKTAEGRWVIDDGEELIDLFDESTKNKVVGNVYENSELVG